MFSQEEFLMAPRGICHNKATKQMKISAKRNIPLGKTFFGCTY